MFLLQFSNASECINEATGKEKKWCLCTQYIKTTSIDTNFTAFKKSCLESGESNGLLLSNSMICIPGLCKPIFLWKPNKYLDIEMSNVEVVEIGLHTLTISMYLSIVWMDHRFQMFRNKSNLEMFYLSKDEQKKIWSPQIVIGTKKLSQNEQGLEFGVFKEPSWVNPMVTKNVDLTTQVKCELDFQLFPFDKHLCKLEVR